MIFELIRSAPTPTPTFTPEQEEFFEYLKEHPLPAAMDGRGKNLLDGIAQEFVYPTVKETALDTVKEILFGLYYAIEPIVDWGAKATIVISIVVYFVCKDKRTVRNGLIAFFVFILFRMLGMAVD